PAMTLSAWAASLANGEGAPLNEVYWDPVVEVRAGALASVWAPYRIARGASVLHCGIDHFGLMKLDGAWRVTDLRYTAEPGGCDDLRPGPGTEIRPAALADAQRTLDDYFR
ncbi:MAG: hypothetical protein ACFBRM_11475, partial [Pikeienuella sp.]